MKDILEKLKNLETIAREIYNCCVIPLHKQSKIECIETLNKIHTGLDNLAKNILESVRTTNLQYAKEINFKKMKLFSENFLIMSSKAKRQMVLEKNKKNIENDLVKIKDDITRPELYFHIEEDLKNELNLFLDFLNNINTQLKHRYTSIGAKSKSTDELLKLLDIKDTKIIELNKTIDKYKWLEAKEKSKDSSISELEVELIKKSKASEQNLTILKLHVIQIERELDKMYRHIKQLNNDISHLEARNIEKENTALELIKELKDELLSTRYVLSKRYIK